MTEQDARKVYADIIDLPHPQSAAHRHMPLHDRAAQFAPFAALSGYEDMVAKVARITSRGSESSEGEIDIIKLI